MKKLIIYSMAILSLSSCVTSRNVPAANNVDQTSYTVLPETKTTCMTNRIWILFIPLHQKTDDKREGQCLNRMKKQYNADGVASQSFVSRKFTIPLILFTYTFKWTTLTGKPIVLKTK